MMMMGLTAEDQHHNPTMTTTMPPLATVPNSWMSSYVPAGNV